MITEIRSAIYYTESGKLVERFGVMVDGIWKAEYDSLEEAKSFIKGLRNEAV